MFEAQVQQILSNPPLAIAAALALIVGAVSLGKTVLSLLTLIFDIFLNPGLPLSRFGAGQGHWAIVTGATDGMGKCFAIELARRGFHVLIVGRNPAKLDAARAEIRAANPDAEVRTHQLDFAHATAAEYTDLQTQLEALPSSISVLVNNVGVSHDIPTPFHLESLERIHDIVEVNINAMLRITHMVVPGMISQGRGLIINSGSFSGSVPSPLLSVYSGSKSFVSTWSQALGAELQAKGVIVEHLNTYFVVSAMSKIRRPSFFIPMPDTYVRSVLSRIGVRGGSSVPFTSSPILSHALANWTVDNFFSRQFWVMYNYTMHVDIRKRALKKREREAAAKQN
ncbi:hypothetical protein H4R33_004817 [Dimargaris cristalligena]|uniref:Very-long-chain 3-oxoacyl-CoA reductase n=1 Tax=Dimargaris cristalligena TaxID=215637 RepID=A0A4P9ZTJ8_9FUNG|nr:hypothetical protein H4R33_004817 [Dimargaris cristalligena]RKP36072.1 hypothetical protein BJ085DRAFT_40570 [Dimargaris cristalligena]|eukprot:RKP36072.1 hypothetical protein BJ085DRAFT_40570 [Dimargaris cristalligena]